jgi:hypothetical protein
MQQGMQTDPAMMAMAQGGNPSDPGTYQEAESLLQQQAQAQQQAQIQPGSGVYT